MGPRSQGNCEARVPAAMSLKMAAVKGPVRHAPMSGGNQVCVCVGGPTVRASLCMVTSVCLGRDACASAGAWRCRTSSEVLPLVDGAVAAQVPLHPPEEVDHGALRQQPAHDGRERQLAAGVERHCQSKGTRRG